MAGIMDFFKKPEQQQQQQNQQQQQQQNQNNQQQNNQQNLSATPPTAGPDGKMPGTLENMGNPLDVYATMFDNAANNSEIHAPKFALDPKVLTDVSKQMDFTKGINPEALQKATSGDVNSLLDIIKQVGQNSYRAAIEHGAALTDTFINTRSEYESKQLNKGVREHLTASALSDTPNYQHPVVKKELNRIASQFAAANPDASPQEVAQAAKKYIDDLQSALNPSTKKTGTSGADDGDEMDWSKYLTDGRS